MDKYSFDVENAVLRLLEALERERAFLRRSPRGVLRIEIEKAINTALNALYLDGRICVERAINGKLITTVDTKSDERRLAKEV